MTTRYIYMNGLEKENKGTLDRGIRLHGTNRDGNLGTKDSVAASGSRTMM